MPENPVRYLEAVLGLPPLKWLHEAKGVNLVIMDLINEVLGTSLVWPDFSDPLNVILSGPSLALISIIIYNWWVFVGYDTVIYLAGLGAIPHDLLPERHCRHRHLQSLQSHLYYEGVRSLHIRGREQSAEENKEGLVTFQAGSGNYEKTKSAVCGNIWAERGHIAGRDS